MLVERQKNKHSIFLRSISGNYSIISSQANAVFLHRFSSLVLRHPGSIIKSWNRAFGSLSRTSSRILLGMVYKFHLSAENSLHLRFIVFNQLLNYSTSEIVSLAQRNRISGPKKRKLRFISWKRWIRPQIYQRVFSISFLLNNQQNVNADFETPRSTLLSDGSLSRRYSRPKNDR